MPLKAGWFGWGTDEVHAIYQEGSIIAAVLGLVPGAGCRPLLGVRVSQPLRIVLARGGLCCSSLRLLSDSYGPRTVTLSQQGQSERELAEQL